jgi:mono/diheme cytochrome c family protein
VILDSVSCIAREGPTLSASAARYALITLAAAGATALLAAVVFVVSGAYNVSASAQHTGPVYSVLHTTMRHSVRLRARAVHEPPLTAADLRARGFACFRRHCEECHGAPGVAAKPQALAMQPLPQPLMDAAYTWRPRELYWIADHGIKMSGMPAFGTHVAGADLWAIVAFLQELPRIAPADYASRAAKVPECERRDETSADEPDVHAAGRRALRAYGCHGCHTIPGITGPTDVIASPLAGFASRRLIAGRWPLEEALLVEWIRRPQELDPRTAMPTLGVSEGDARLMARYLLELK